MASSKAMRRRSKRRQVRKDMSHLMVEVNRQRRRLVAGRSESYGPGLLPGAATRTIETVRSVAHRRPPADTERARAAWIDGPWVMANVFDDGLLYAVVCDADPTGEPFWRDVVRRDPCCYCGEPVTPHRLPDGTVSEEPDRGTTEHLTQKARGGRGLDGNTVGACAACNHSRRDLTLLDMLLRERGEPTILDLAETAKRQRRAA